MEPGVYLYISSSKIRTLKRKSGPLHLTELSLVLKPMWLEVGAKVAFDSTLERDLRQVEMRLTESQDVKPFELLTDSETPLFFSFRGESGRLIDDTKGSFWLAIQKQQSALLLAGSAGNLVGNSNVERKSVSPSVDPLGAVTRAFGGGDPSEMDVPLDMSTRLLYAWQDVMSTVEGMQRPPSVEGLAIFAGIYPVSSATLAPSRVIVGSPIFVRQVAA
jgi:hypothetical protein